MTKGWQAQKQRYLKAGKMGDTKLPRILVVPTEQACMGRQTGATSAILPNCREHARQSAGSVHNIPPGWLFRVLMTCKNWCWPHQRTPYDYKRVLDKAVPQINLSSLGVVVSNTLLKVKAWIVKDCMDFKIGWQRAQTAHLLSSSHWHHHQA